MIDWMSIVSAIIGTGIITTVVTHWLTKKKFYVEIDQLKAQVKQIQTQTDGDSISNMDKSLEFYEKFVEATNKRLDEMLMNQGKIIKENITLKNQVTEVNSRMTKLASVICTKLTCIHREVDEDVVNCIYPHKDKDVKDSINKSKKV